MVERWEQWQADRVLILGNGPSLDKAEFDKIKADKVIAVNRIQSHPIWSTGWRPDFHIVQDKANNKLWMEDMMYHLQQGYPCLIADRLVEQADSPNRHNQLKGRYTWKNLHIFYQCKHRNVGDHQPTSFHPPNLCGFAGPVYVGAQVAMYYWNPKEILLLGCDSGYGILPANFGDGNYLPENAPNVYVQEGRGDRQNKTLALSHQIIQTEADKRGIEVWNLSPVSKILAHERRDANDFF